jgi:hypothetical protein
MKIGIDLSWSLSCKRDSRLYLNYYKQEIVLGDTRLDPIDESGEETLTF